MLKVIFEKRHASLLKLLCIGAHSDDIEIGCGGTVVRLLEENPNTEVHWVVVGAMGQRANEAVESANLFLANAKRKEIVIKQFRDGFFPYSGSDIKDFFEKLKGECSPDLILTHYRGDLHQDHRLVSELTWNTFRNHLILEYEIPKYDGDLGSPNLFVRLDDATCQQKVTTLMQCFQSQQHRDWFTADAFFALLRLRGIESRARYAEAFHCRKVTV